MDFSIQGSRPIWQQLMEQLARRIITGVYPQGSRFPAVRELAAEAGVNPNTMQRALAQLEAEGLVRTERTSGRFVTEDTDLIEQLRASAARNIAADFLEKMRSIGYTPQQAAELLRSWNETEGKQHE